MTEEKLRTNLINWINKWDVVYLNERTGHHGKSWIVDIDDLMKQIKPFIKKQNKELIEEMEVWFYNEAEIYWNEAEKRFKDIINNLKKGV